jgi:hypothetical protein
MGIYWRRWGVQAFVDSADYSEKWGNMRAGDLRRSEGLA